MIEEYKFIARNIIYCAKQPRRAYATIKAMREFKQKHPACEVCGEMDDVDVHHIKPVHLFPELAADQDNFGSACNKNDCHKVVGHFNDYRNSYNANFRAVARMMREGRRKVQS